MDQKLSCWALSQHSSPDEHPGRNKHPDPYENPARSEHPGDRRGDGVDGVDDHRHPDEGSGSGGDGSDHGTSGSGNDPIDDLPRYDEKGNPLYDDHGDPVEVDRGDGRKHYASDPEGTFRSQDDRLRHSDNGQSAEDPYAHRPKGIKYHARKILLGDHDWNNPALAERAKADTRIWDEARTKARTDRRAATQAINDIETLRTRDGKKLQLDTTDKSYRKLAEEVKGALSALVSIRNRKPKASRLSTKWSTLEPTAPSGWGSLIWVVRSSSNSRTDNSSPNSSRKKHNDHIPPTRIHHLDQQAHAVSMAYPSWGLRPLRRKAGLGAHLAAG